VRRQQAAGSSLSRGDACSSSSTLEEISSQPALQNSVHSKLQFVGMGWSESQHFTRSQCDMESGFIEEQPKDLFEMAIKHTAASHNAATDTFGPFAHDAHEHLRLRTVRVSTQSQQRTHCHGATKACERNMFT
jgi:hypothetical protein